MQVHVILWLSGGPLPKLDLEHEISFSGEFRAGYQAQTKYELLKDRVRRACCGLPLF